jgi:membrane-associated protein
MRTGLVLCLLVVPALMPGVGPTTLLPLSALARLFDDLRAVLAELPPPLLVAVAFGAAFLETFFPPLPSETILIATAFAGSRTALPPALLVVAAAGGAFLSLFLLYLSGRGPFRERMRRWAGGRFAGFDRKADHFFRHWGHGTLLVSRFLPGIRGPIAFFAGVYGLRPGPAALALGAGCLLWYALVIGLGWRAGQSWDGTPGGLVGMGLLVGAGLVVLWGLGVLVARLLARTSRR